MMAVGDSLAECLLASTGNVCLYPPGRHNSGSMGPGTWGGGVNILIDGETKEHRG